MLRARLLDTINSPGIASILPIDQSRRLVLVKTNGNIEVYSKEDKRLKLFQTYPKLLQDINTNNSAVRDLFYSEELSTVFVQYDNVIALLNGTNFHLYDRITDKRTILKCWLLESQHDKTTYLIYQTKEYSKIRVLIWHNRTYKTVLETHLHSNNEIMKSVDFDKMGLLITTNIGIYFWQLGPQPKFAKLDKNFVKLKYPNDLVSLLNELQGQTLKIRPSKQKKAKPELYNKGKISNDNHSTISKSSKISAKSSFSNLWRRKDEVTTRKKQVNNIAGIRYAFHTDYGKSPVVLDQITQNLFQLEILHGDGSDSPSTPSYKMIVHDHSEFFKHYSMFSDVQYIETNILMLNNYEDIKFVDCNSGFTFLDQNISEGIKSVKLANDTVFLVWTDDDQIQLYEYQVDDDVRSAIQGVNDSQNDSNSEVFSLCSQLNTEFEDLWRKVLFYKFFLNSSNSIILCNSSNPQESLNIAAMKLRDLTVMWCLEIFEQMKSLLDDLTRYSIEITNIQNLIIRDIFTSFIEFWAPPELIILKTFPFRLSRLVSDITGEDHQCLFQDNEVQNDNKTKSTTYEIPAKVFTEWCIPYLVEMRRHMKNLMINKEKGITWKYQDRSIQEHFDFFLLNDHKSPTIETMLELLDTVLFEAYLQYLPTMLGPFVRVSNMCNEKIVARDLREHHLFEELIDFYFQRGRHTEALEFLTSEFFNEAETGATRDEIKGKIKILVIAYLTKVPSDFLDIIFKYTSWLLENFKATTDEHEDILASILFRDSPLKQKTYYLKIYDFINIYNQALSMKYLEFIFSTGISDSAHLHTILIRRYLQEINNTRIRAKLKSMLETTIFYDPQNVLVLLEEMLDKTDLSDDQRSFLNLLRTYPLNRLGEHEKALNILYVELSSYSNASSYCEKLYHIEEKEGIRVLMYWYQKLIEEYGQNSDGEAENQTKSATELIKRFLKDHSRKLDATAVLKILPKTISMDDLGDILIEIVKFNSIKKNDLRIVKNVLQVELVNKSKELNDFLSTNVNLTEMYTCPVCNKTFSSFTVDSIFWFDMPNDKKCVVHYNCGRVLQSRLEANIQRKKSIQEKFPNFLQIVRKCCSRLKGVHSIKYSSKASVLPQDHLNFLPTKRI
ncbi:hypothetical protein KAFR_0G03340 [Kazachstania africana CBS 2517]|uniref:Vacuolar sorting protein 39/Transforming growth factor beta receptor-associated domain-containing protein n=1 Tax=Kazachstania africana (strain ATCC 22294 / BCRC 22015 / CBS 2517 / CECT 1963 / NBRC 1671 / NRRL Y-8276) TaxID=1071382 RepID=H2AYB6_KAZAF|nr:hypothetical protein KAFR_0G03340 [Kazachstania africana CBS 2517]CCF59366.1 hypothetical protein KAFR_0G03340 [Kazachstania africana CBS 2517]